LPARGVPDAIEQGVPDVPVCKSCRAYFLFPLYTHVSILLKLEKEYSSQAICSSRLSTPDELDIEDHEDGESDRTEDAGDTEPTVGMRL
jgi:hypothetical protein